MKAVVCKTVGPAFALAIEELPSRPPDAGEVRVRIHAAGVSHSNLLTVLGSYHDRLDAPFVPGTEAAGEVLESGAN